MRDLLRAFADATGPGLKALRYAIGLGAVLSGAAFAQQGDRMIPPPRPDGQWSVRLLAGVTVSAEDEVTLAFDAGRVSGSTGCNRVFGSYSLMPGFAFEGLGMTRRGCVGRMAELERAFTTMVEGVNDWRIDPEGRLELLKDDRPLLSAVLLP